MMNMNTKKTEAVYRLVNHLMTKLNMNESIEDIVRSYKETDVSVNPDKVYITKEICLDHGSCL